MATTKNNTAPTCCQCGKRLPKHWLMLDSVRGGNRAKQTPLETRRLGVRSWDEGWFGDYGYLGNNYFCTLTCGYIFGVQRAQHIVGQRNAGLLAMQPKPAPDAPAKTQPQSVTRAYQNLCTVCGAAGGTYCPHRY